jgi:cytochrome c oxidase subunit IV
MRSAAFPKAVVRTGAALFALWALSFGLSYVHLGPAALPVALAIAAVKAVLVVLFFMELLREGLSMKLTLMAGGALLAVLIGLVVADVAAREPPPLVPFGTQPGLPTATDLPSR